MESSSTAIMATLPCQINFFSLHGHFSMWLQIIWLVVLSINYYQPLQHLQSTLCKWRVCHVAKTLIWRSSRNGEVPKYWEQSQGQIPTGQVGSSIFILEGSIFQYAFLPHVCKASLYHGFPQHWQYINNPAHFESKHFHMSGHFYTDICALKATHTSLSTFHAF